MRLVQNTFKHKWNLDLYLVYGTLLGALREQDFIPHDYDIDMAYHSKYQSKEDVIKEFTEIKNYFDKKKLLYKSHMLGHFIYYSGVKAIDIWTSFVSKNKLYLVNAFDGNIPNYATPLKMTQFKGYNFYIPNEPDKLLTAIYKDWKTPIKEDFCIIKGRKIL